MSARILSFIRENMLLSNLMQFSGFVLQLNAKNFAFSYFPFSVKLSENDKKKFSIILKNVFFDFPVNQNRDFYKISNFLKISNISPYILKIRILFSIRELKQAEIKHILKLLSSHGNNDKNSNLFYQLSCWFEFAYPFPNGTPSQKR